MDKVEKRTKIVVTVGPACASSVIIQQLIDNGANVFRMNLSHGNHQSHAENIRIIRKTAEAKQQEVAILADLQGPKIRTRRTEHDMPIQVLTGTTVCITSRKVPCTDTTIAIDYNKLGSEVDCGQVIMINDGAICLKVSSKTSSGDLFAKVISGGEYASHKGVNFPDVDLSIPSLTAKDRKDLAFVLEQDIQYVALSFVRKPEDILALRKLMGTTGKTVKVIAKIEKPEATRRIAEILPHTDGIMVARGDLGVETSPFIVPVMQKDLIRIANNAGKIVIVATQMLESMIEHPLPTRAESTDVANAIIDGTDAIMLSGETAVGHYPAAAVATMHQIALEVEKSSYCRYDTITPHTVDHYPPYAICEAAVWAGRELSGIPLCVYTISGATALYLSKLRYEAPVFAFSPDIQVVRMLSLAWNIQSYYLPFANNIAKLHTEGETFLIKRQWIKKGDDYGIISGTNSVPGATNSFRIKRAGEKN